MKLNPLQIDLLKKHLGPFPVLFLQGHVCATHAVLGIAYRQTYR